MADLLFYAMYTTSKVGTTGLTVTIDIWRVTRSSAATSEVVTAGSASPLGDGVYFYRLASADPTLYDYVAIFKTATATVDQQDIPALWTQFGMESNIAQISGDATAADNAELFFDGTGYAGTNNVIPTVTTITNPVTMGAMNAAGAQDFFTVDSTDLFADAVAGSVVKEIADHATIVASAVSAATLDAALTGSTVSIRRGDTLSATFTGLSANTGYVSLDFTVKSDKDDTDDNCILRIRLNAPSASDGLLRLNKAALVAPVVAGDGVITVNSATSITITLAARATDDLAVFDGYYYDVQYIFATSVLTATEGICNVTGDVTRAIA